MRAETVEKCLKAQGLIDAGTPIAQAVKQSGVTAPTFLKWRSGGVAAKPELSMVERLAAEIAALERERESLVAGVDQKIATKRARLGQALADKFFAEMKKS